MDEIEETASYWLVKLTTPDCTSQDRVAFEQWKREDPHHMEAYERLQRGNSVVDQYLNDPDILLMVEGALERTRPPFWRRPTARFASIAASIAAAIAIAVTSTLFVGNQTPGGPELIAYETAIGERSTVALPDGSIVTLNTDSRIVVDFSASERNVDLIRGQSYFEVAQDETRPFVVDAGDKRVTALGTAFDVRYRNETAVEVTLVKGLVEVDRFEGSAAADRQPTALEPVYTIRLEPGQRLVASTANAPEVVTPLIANEIAWRDGRLIFQDRPLAEVVLEMNRYSTQKLALDDDPRVQELRVNGVFNTGRASTFVAALETMHPLEASRTGRNQLTLVWRE